MLHYAHESILDQSRNIIFNDFLTLPLMGGGADYVKRTFFQMATFSNPPTSLKTAPIPSKPGIIGFKFSFYYEKKYH